VARVPVGGDNSELLATVGREGDCQGGEVRRGGDKGGAEAKKGGSDPNCKAAAAISRKGGGKPGEMLEGPREQIEFRVIIGNVSLLKEYN
jgi:hypothetical protein